jgi:hypothetical protein
MLEPEKAGITVLVEGIPDRVRPDCGVGEGLLRSQYSAHFGQRSRVLQVHLGEKADDPMSLIAKAIDGGWECHQQGGQ